MQFQASEAEQQTLRLALAATVAQGYVALLSLDRQLLLTHETVRSRRAALAVAEDRSRMGYTSELEQTQARSEYGGRATGAAAGAGHPRAGTRPAPPDR